MMAAPRFPPGPVRSPRWVSARSRWPSMRAAIDRHGKACRLAGGTIGCIVGGWLVADQPINRGVAEMRARGTLSPGFAVGASLLWIGGLAVGMVLYHRAIDDHEERAWLWACVAGWYAFIFPAPAWWALHRAGMAPPVDAMLLFLLSLIANAIVWMWLKFR